MVRRRRGQESIRSKVRLGAKARAEIHAAARPAQKRHSKNRSKPITGRMEPYFFMPAAI